MKNPKSHFPPPNEAYCLEKPMLESSNHWARPMLANTKKDSNYPQNLQSWKLSPCHSLSQPLKLSLSIIFPNADLLINRYADHFSSLQPGNLLMNCSLHQLSGSTLLDSDCSVELGDSSTSSSRLVEAAIWYGVAVHFRIYPIIYVLPILLILSDNYVKGANVLDFSNVNAQAAEKHESVDNVQSSCSIANHGQDITSLHKKTHKSILGGCFHAAQCLNRHRIQFGLISGGVFFLLTGICYKLYGTDFLHEALLYHVTRTDPRHNFSIYFYYIYLHQNYEFSIIERLVAFIPQMFMQVVLAAYFFKDIPFCLFLQTVGFVAFNKVITAQYFVWFFCLLPLILPSISLKFKWKGALCMALWSGAQLHWLAWAYLLEFQGKNVFFQLWLASIIFFAANMFIISIFILSYSRNNTQLDSKTSLSIPAHHKKSE